MLAAFKKSFRVIAVPRCLVLLFHDANCAILLAQLLYWLGKRKDGSFRAGVTIDGERYIANTCADWATQTGLPKRRIRTVIGNLIESGLIKTTVAKYQGRTQLHIAVVVPALCDAIEIAVLQEQLDQGASGDDTDSASASTGLE